MPLPLGYKIAHVFPLPLCAYLLALPQALERIAQGSLWLEEGADLLRTEAFRMLIEQGQNPLAHTPTPSRSPRSLFL